MEKSRGPLPPSRRRTLFELLAYGAACGLLIAALEAGEYRLLAAGQGGAFAALVAACFAGLGIFLGATLRRERRPAAEEPAPAGSPAADGFTPDPDRRAELGITPRELEILGLIAEGLSNREIAERLFLSENTVKTHSSRIFEKLGARRRTQAVQLGKSLGLLS